MEHKEVFYCPKCNSPIEQTDAEYLVCLYCGILLSNDGEELEEYNYDEG